MQSIEDGVGWVFSGCLLGKGEKVGEMGNDFGIGEGGGLRFEDLESDGLEIFKRGKENRRLSCLLGSGVWDC